jgi:hypothetical protein
MIPRVLLTMIPHPPSPTSNGIELGLFESVDEKIIDRGTVGLYGTHTRGTDLLATRTRGELTWEIVVIPARGRFLVKSEATGA